MVWSEKPAYSIRILQGIFHRMSIRLQCMYLIFYINILPTNYYRFDQYTENIKIDNVSYNVTLWDTAGQEDYERLRPLAYPRVKSSLLFYQLFLTKKHFFRPIVFWYVSVYQKAQVLTKTSH